nr:MalY/PatB family protein [Anaeromicropila herbilytica]
MGASVNEEHFHTYNFDEVIDRRNTNSVKHDFAVERGKSEDVMPFWVADMDFRSAPAIVEKMKEKAEFGIYGYSDPKQSYFDSVISWMERRHGWQTKKEWYIYTPGVIFALGIAIRSLTKEGDGILIQKPVYYPFQSMIQKNNRVVINNPLHLVEDEDGMETYKMDTLDFEQKIIQNNVKMFILCNPHNPVGRVWSKEELETIGDICLKHNVIVVSDEIHADFVYEPYRHIVFSNMKEEYKDITVTLTSPSKTFNLAGTQVSNTIVCNQAIRDIMKIEQEKIGYDNLGLFGLTAAQTAYSEGEEWLESLKTYLQENMRYVEEFLKIRIPEIKLIKPEGTYLLWLDCRGLGLSDKELDTIILEKAKLWLDHGIMFGEEGSGFQRINIATSRVNLEKALESLEYALKH